MTHLFSFSLFAAICPQVSEACDLGSDTGPLPQGIAHKISIAGHAYPCMILKEMLHSSESRLIGSCALFLLSEYMIGIFVPFYAVHHLRDY